MQTSLKKIFNTLSVMLIVFVLWNNGFCVEDFNFNHSIIIKNGTAAIDTSIFKSNNFQFSNSYKTNLMLGQFQVKVHADFQMAYIYIYNELGVDIFNSVNDTTYLINLEYGNYHFFVGYAPTGNKHLMLIYDNIKVFSNIELNFNRNDAQYSTTYKFYKYDYSELRINTIGFYLFNNLIGYGLALKHSNIDSTAFILKYNSIPNYFDGQWSVKGKPLANGGNLYLLNNILKDFSNDTTIVNRPSSYSSARFYYHLPDSIEQNYLMHLFTYIPNSHTVGSNDPDYQSPYIQKIYQDTSAEKTLLTSKFWQSIKTINLLGDWVQTQEIKIRDGFVEGFHYADPNKSSFIISETNEVHIGLTPTYWCGKFVNKSDTIKIIASEGRYEYLFLSQSNDVLRHYPLSYSIWNDNQLYVMGQFNLRFPPDILRFGINPDDLKIPVTPAKYEMIVSDTKNEVIGQPGISQVKAIFDLNKVDKNPPYLTIFQMLSNNNLTNHFYPNNSNKVRFKVFDDVGITSLNLYFTEHGDSAWNNLTLNYTEPYWEAQIPQLGSGYYDWKLTASDTSQNTIECLMLPGFYYDLGVGTDYKDIIPIIENLTISQNYPNPFNSTTSFLLQIPINFNSKIEISIFDILGQNVKTISNDHIQGGNFKIYWDGTNNWGQQAPSGFYFIKLKGGDIELIRKLLLIR